MQLFQKHTNNIDSFRKYEAESNAKKAQLVFTNTTYAQFKSFFTNKLKFLYTDQRRTAHQANHADILLNRVAALEHNMADMSMVQDERSEDLESAQAYHSQARAAPPDTFCLPRDDAITDTAADSTLASTATLQAMLADQAAQHQSAQRAFEARIEQLVSNRSNNGKQNGDNSSQNNDTGGKRGYKQYKFYCMRHGVNISHAGKDCKDKQPNHNDNATFANQMGGSTRNVHLHMMWRQLDKPNQLCQTCPPGQAAT